MGHYNRAMGKYYHSDKDLTKDMKKYGMEPYTGPQKQEPQGYKPSKWANDMATDIQARAGRPAGGRFHDEIRRKDPSYDPRKRSEDKRRAMQAYEKYGPNGGLE